MPLPLYLALTAPEISAADCLPEQLAYMACHFSPYGTGLSNFPQRLPPGSMLILNDATPAEGHDPEVIGRQLSELCASFHCSCILLDFQRPFNDLTCRIAEAIILSVSCPVAVSENYAVQLKCPVFLSAPPADRLLRDYLEPWKEWEIWLEAALDAKSITVDKAGSRTVPADPCDPALLPHREKALHCHYKIETTEDAVHFTLQRTADDLRDLLEEAESLGVVGAAGLYQELGAEFYQ